MERKKNLEYYSIRTLIIIYLVGLVGHSLPMFKPIMLKLTPFTLLFTSALVFVNLLVKKENRLLLWILTIFIFTMTIEIIGVKTKLIFGNYQYGEILGPKICDVPFVIGINWVLIILGVTQISQRIINNKYMQIFTVGFLTILFDYILEPIAMELGYWEWMNNIIPMKNYIAWFVISIIASIYLILIERKQKNNLIMYLIIIQFSFFGILRIIYGVF